MKNYNIHLILINNESLADGLYFDAIMKMGITLDQLTLVDSPLVRLMGDTIYVEGMIFLTVRMGHYPLRFIT